MSDLDWDDPNYVEKPAVHQEYSKPNNKYERSIRRDGNSRAYKGDRNDYGGEGRGYRAKRNDYGGGRRDNRDNYGAGHRDSRDSAGGGGGDFSESLSIASEMVGKVIGRGGSNISRIQNDFNVRVKLDKCDLIVKITGSIQSNVIDAINHVRKQVTNSGDRGQDRDNRDHGSNERYDGGGYDRYKGNSYEFNPTSSESNKDNGDLTGIIDWEALNKASVSTKEKLDIIRSKRCILTDSSYCGTVVQVSTANKELLQGGS